MRISRLKGLIQGLNLVAAFLKVAVLALEFLNKAVNYAPGAEKLRVFEAQS
jgi:hypothetical protein